MNAAMTMTTTKGKTMAREENSVQFSLDGLLKLEDERVAGEARERTAREKAAKDAKVAIEREKQAAHSAKMKAEADAVAAEKKAELDQLAQREAMQKAIVEQARIQVEAKMRADERERERRHELDLEVAKKTEKQSSMGALMGACGFGGGLMLLVFGVIHFAVTQPATDRRMAELELRATTAEQHAADSDHKVDEAQKQLRALDAKRASLETELDGLKNQPVQPTGKKPVAPITGKIPPHNTTTTDTGSQDCPGGDKDPMCFKIRRSAP
jgi:hypothetical protein